MNVKGRNKRHLIVRPIAPFRLDLTVWALRRRNRNIIDRWDGHSYRRTLVINRQPVEITVIQSEPAGHPLLEVTASGEDVWQETRSAAEDAVRRMLGTEIDVEPFYRLADRDDRLQSLAAKFKGLKPPRFPSTFEALINAVSCQQLSLTVGIELLNRVAATCGGGSLDGRPAFPSAESLLRISPETFRRLGYSRQKAGFILGIASAVSQQKVDLEALNLLDNQSAAKSLLLLRGVGRWTAEYVLLRGLGRLDVFPADDVGARNGLVRWLNRTDKAMDYAAVHEALAAWRPYAGFIYFHLLLEGLARTGEMRVAPVTRTKEGKSNGRSSTAVRTAAPGRVLVP